MNHAEHPRTESKAIQAGSDGVYNAWMLVRHWVGKTVRQAASQTVNSLLF